MSNKIFQAILERKIDNFIKSFVIDSRSIFYKDDILIHPGEYGKYRENTLKDLLKILIPTDFKINDGFVITAKDEVSTQCDIVIYNSSELPFLNDGISQFYPIESVLAIGEVKSDLDKKRFKEALVKLARNKMLQDSRLGTEKKRKYSFKENDYLNTFLVCRKLTFNFDFNFDEIYGDIPCKYWHNCILSIEEGLLAYNLDFDKFPEPMRANAIRRGLNLRNIVVWEYPLHQEGESIYKCYCEKFFIYQENKYKHITMFLQSIVSTLDSMTLYNTEFLHYSNLEKAELFKQ
jgi:hypothetical protein